MHYRKKGVAKVLRDEIIELEYHPEDKKYKVRGPAGVVQHVLIAGPCRPLRVLFISNRFTLFSFAIINKLNDADLNYQFVHMV